MRVALDATPLLGRTTGVGRYTTRLAEGLGLRAECSDDLRITLVPFTVRRSGGLPQLAGTTTRHVRVPARLLRAAWSRSGLPPVELISGRCDVFHATNFVLPPRRRAAGVVTVHDLTFVRYPELVTATVERYRTLVPRSVRTADVVLCPARATAEDVAAEYALDPSRVRVTPLGVEPSWLTARPATAGRLRELGLPERYVVFVGTREPRKDLGTLRQAHAQMVAADPSSPALVLVGPAGWGQQPPPGPGVHHLDYLPEASLRSVVAAASALVMPSRYEGFGLPLLEGLACGIPVVATDLPVHREVAGTHARFVPVHDADALAGALVQAVAEPSTESARSSRRAWAARWTWDSCVDATLEAYRAVTGP